MPFMQRQITGKQNIWMSITQKTKKTRRIQMSINRSLQNWPTDTTLELSCAGCGRAEVCNANCPALMESLEAKDTWFRYVAWVEERVG